MLRGCAEGGYKGLLPSKSWMRYAIRNFSSNFPGVLKPSIVIMVVAAMVVTGVGVGVAVVMMVVVVINSGDGGDCGGEAAGGWEG